MWHTEMRNRGDYLPYVPVPKDLTKVKTKVVFNLTKRQLICFSLGGVIGIPAYFVSKAVIGNTPALLMMMALMAPFFLFAMYEKDGQPAEKLLKNRLRFMIWPKQRPYKTRNIYHSDKGEMIIGENQAAVRSGNKTAAKHKTVKKAPR